MSPLRTNDGSPFIIVEKLNCEKQLEHLKDFFSALHLRFPKVFVFEVC